MLDGRAEVRFAAMAAALSATVEAAAIDQILARYPVPRKHADLARMALGLRSDLASGTPPGAKQLLTSLQQADAFRRTERFNDALLVCRALESAGAGKLGIKVDALERVAAAARAVSGAELSRRGLRGEDLAEELDRRRLIAIEESLATT